MLDGAYRYATWTLLFTVVWVQLSLVALLYVACFAFCVFGLVFSQSARFQAWNLSDYRNIFAKSLALVTCGSCTLVLYFMFWTNLAKRLDGDHSVTFESILIPMMIKCGPEVPSPQHEVSLPADMAVENRLADIRFFLTRRLRRGLDHGLMERRRA